MIILLVIGIIILLLLMVILVVCISVSSDIEKYDGLYLNSLNESEEFLDDNDEDLMSIIQSSINKVIGDD